MHAGRISQTSTSRKIAQESAKRPALEALFDFFVVEQFGVPHAGEA